MDYDTDANENLIRTRAVIDAVRDRADYPDQPIGMQGPRAHSALAILSVLDSHLAREYDRIYGGTVFQDIESRYVYLVAAPNTSDAYLGFGAAMVGLEDGAQIVAISECHREWQAMRLSSGMALHCPMMGFATEVEARAHAREMEALLGRAR